MVGMRQALSKIWLSFRMELPNAKQASNSKKIKKNGELHANFQRKKKPNQKPAQKRSVTLH